MEGEEEEEEEEEEKKKRVFKDEDEERMRWGDSIRLGIPAVFLRCLSFCFTSPNFKSFSYAARVERRGEEEGPAGKGLSVFSFSVCPQFLSLPACAEGAAASGKTQHPDEVGILLSLAWRPFQLPQLPPLLQVSCAVSACCAAGREGWSVCLGLVASGVEEEALVALLLSSLSLASSYSGKKGGEEELN